jgi:membrane-bound lytic murein transglycosylase MltF
MPSRKLGQSLPSLLLLLSVGLIGAFFFTVISGDSSDASDGLSVLSAIPGRADSVETGPIERPDDLLTRAIGEPWKGDLPEMIERRRIRVLVSHSRTNFFLSSGKVAGFEAEMLEGYEDFLNEKLGRKTLAVDVVYVPVRFDRLLSDLQEGRGDIAAAGLTVTPDREKKVAFTDPYLPNISEVVVAHESAAELAELSDLGGRRVIVTAGSSYVDSLRRLDAELRKAGRPAIDIVEADPSLVTEDLLELVNSGAFELTVVDRHVAELWGGVLDDLVVRKDLEVATGGRIAWAVRRGDDELRAGLNDYLRSRKKGTMIGNVLFKRYFQNAKFISNPLGVPATRQLAELLPLFQKYGRMYDVDWLLVAAQAFKESGFDQSVRSRAGAVGVMQLLPSTAGDPRVGISDITKVENNVHAGVKYLDLLRDSYFDSLANPEDSRFSLASYNAGPRRVRELRGSAQENGFDPDVWFGNVEHAAATRIGSETVRYVSEINKYYLTYKLSVDLLRSRGIEIPGEDGSS